MIRVACLGVFLTFVESSLFGADPLPRLDQIAAQHQKAPGGPAALEKASALVLSGVTYTYTFKAVKALPEIEAAEFEPKSARK
jgi:hypothetical protein